jgi:hypothetical protein
MRRYVRGISLCLLFSVGVLAWGVGASQSWANTGPAPSMSGFGGVGGGALVVGWPMEGEQLAAAHQVRLVSPGTFVAREVSRTEFAHLGGAEAARVASRTFPGFVDGVDGGLPALARGERVAGYPADGVAQVRLAGGEHGVIVSTGPMASEVARGRRAPLDLSLVGAGGLFTPKVAAVGVRIPKRAGAGVGLGDTGVSLTPVAVSGVALAGSEGVLDGASVLYANTETDADTAVKPIPTGFEEDTVLRSVESPQQLFYRVGVPVGARLVQMGSSVEVTRGARTIATVGAPVAVDAEGTGVAVKVAISGDTLVVTVDDRGSQVRYPVLVDPTVTDPEFLYNRNWLFEAEPVGPFSSYGENGYFGDNDTEQYYAKPDLVS